MGQCMTEHVDTLSARGTLEPDKLVELLRFRNEETTKYLYERASMVRMRRFEDVIALWGRIPISSHCKNDCNYCGLRRSNRFAKRFRLTREQVLTYCGAAYEMGVRNFYLEGGVDLHYAMEDIGEMIGDIKRAYPDCGIVLGLGERRKEAYTLWKEKGADFCMMPEDCIQDVGFKRIHSPNMSLLKRKHAMWECKELNMKTGAGFLVGFPNQTVEHVVEELFFLKQFGPGMISIAPFVPADRTPYEKERSGNVDMALYLQSIAKLMNPTASIVSDTSIDCVMKNGRLESLQSGANALIFDIAPREILQQYHVYNADLMRRQELSLKESISLIKGLGYRIATKGMDRG